MSEAESEETALSWLVLETASMVMVSNLMGDIEVKYIRLLYRGVGADRAKVEGAKGTNVRMEAEKRRWK